MFPIDKNKSSLGNSAHNLARVLPILHVLVRLPNLLPPPADLAVDEEIWVLPAMHLARLKKATGEGDPSLVIAHHVS